MFLFEEFLSPLIILALFCQFDHNFLYVLITVIVGVFFKLLPSHRLAAILLAVNSTKWGQIKDEKKACVCVSSSRLSHTFSNTLWSRTHYLFMSFSFPLPFSRLMTQQQRTKNLHVMLMEIFQKMRRQDPHHSNFHHFHHFCFWFEATERRVAKWGF